MFTIASMTNMTNSFQDEETMGSVDGETSEQLPPVDVFTISPEDAALAPFFIPSLC